MRHRDPDMTWMAHGECLNWPQLGWVKDHNQVGLGEESTMRVVCAHCPVRAACEDFVDKAGITGGFWAGRHRTYFGPCLSPPLGEVA